MTWKATASQSNLETFKADKWLSYVLGMGSMTVALFVRSQAFDSTNIHSWVDWYGGMLDDSMALNRSNHSLNAVLNMKVSLTNCMDLSLSEYYMSPWYSGTKALIIIDFIADSLVYLWPKVTFSCKLSLCEIFYNAKLSSVWDLWWRRMFYRSLEMHGDHNIFLWAIYLQCGHGGHF